MTKEERARADAEAAARAKDEAAMKDVALRYVKADLAGDAETRCGLRTETKLTRSECLETYRDSRSKPEEGVTVTVEGGPVDVGPIRNHSAGTGLMLTQKTVVDGHAYYRREAIRMVKVEGKWLVDQVALADDEAMASAVPVRSALMRPAA
ncbi:hypothetical protein [Streptomyces mashuensis]|uniref:hypothetical protein n=1 Tax=Streptomyces mashuensis TaxID=33904 RepID=UPI00167DF20E|nr:hypothetical protein [Streptomyces mashuensis]